MADKLILDAEQTAALAFDLEIEGVAITGGGGTGKTTVLTTHLARTLAPAGTRALALTAANPQVFAARLEAARPALDLSRIQVCSPLRFALLQGRLLLEHRVLDACEAELAFLASATPLLELAWPQLVAGEIDPEVSGLRTPERFLQAIFRLYTKLQASMIDPCTIEESALRATTQFYAHPPNFADAELLRNIKEEHRGSLRADREALEHQRKRELDLTRIVGRLFSDFEDYCATANVRTEAAYVADLATLFETQAAQADIVRRRFASVVIDDAQDLLPVELRLLKAVFGPRLVGVMMAGDIYASTATFRGARPQVTLATPERQIILSVRRRGTLQILRAEQALFSHPQAPAVPETATDDTGSLILERCVDAQAQAETIAAFIGEQLHRGVTPRDCAVALRTLRCGTSIVDALLAHDIPVDLSGDVDFASYRASEDFLAHLWTIAAPAERPDALLRVLASPLVALSDRSIAVLCTAPQDPTLFVTDPVDRQIDRKKETRASRFVEHVLQGENDHALSAPARERLAGLRERLARWQSARSSISLRELLVDVAGESGCVDGSAVQRRFCKNLLTHCIAALVRIAHAHPDYELADILRDFERRVRLEDETHVLPQIDADAVCVASAAALRGRAFAILAIADARAGAFPRYYVPEAVMYSPQRGFIARENAGGVAAARTAKFTWYFEKSGVRDAYNIEERRLFTYAMGRTAEKLLVTAWGPATRGKTAPEFLEELRSAQRNAHKISR